MALAGLYEKGAYVGDTSMTQVGIGLQLGGQAYSQIIFFENKAAFDQFTSGNFEFGAQASAVAIAPAPRRKRHRRDERRRERQ